MNNPVSVLFKLLCFFGVSLGLLFIFGVLGGEEGVCFARCCCCLAFSTEVCKPALKKWMN